MAVNEKLVKELRLDERNHVEKPLLISCMALNGQSRTSIASSIRPSSGLKG
jgi:hypothetical protein